MIKNPVEDVQQMRKRYINEPTLSILPQNVDMIYSARPLSSTPHPNQYYVGVLSITKVFLKVIS
jgi:uncharacterized membrane protein